VAPLDWPHSHQPSRGLASAGVTRSQCTGTCVTRPNTVHRTRHCCTFCELSLAIACFHDRLVVMRANTLTYPEMCSPGTVMAENHVIDRPWHRQVQLTSNDDETVDVCAGNHIARGDTLGDFNLPIPRPSGESDANSESIWQCLTPHQLGGAFARS
jgi:hypothetical protein